MNRTLVALGVSAAALLSGCGPTPQGAAEPGAGGTSAANYSVRRPNGDTIAVATGDAALASLPTYVPIYPGARVETSYRGSGEGSGGAVMFRTTAKPADIMSFYKAQAAKYGLGETFASQSGDGMMLSAGKSGGEEGIQVIATPSEGGAMVQVFWTDPRAG